MSGSHHEDIVRLELLFAAHPGSRIFIHLAEAHRRAGDLARALDTVERGLARGDEDPAAYMILARILLDLDERDRGIVALRRTVELDPDHEEARLTLNALLPNVSASESGSGIASLEDGASPPDGVNPGMLPPIGADVVDDELLTALLKEPDGGEEPSLSVLLDESDAAELLGEAFTPWPEAPPDVRPAADPPFSWESSRPIDASSPRVNVAPVQPAGSADVESRAGHLLPLVDLLIGLLEYRDPLHRGSSSLTRLLAVALGQDLQLGEDEIDRLALGALLRDLGRIALGGRIVEPRPDLGPEELLRIQEHVDLSLRLLDGIPLPAGVRGAIRYHHERWDGFGYPDGLSGEAIPLAARILAVADSLSAMLAPRPYRSPRRLEAAVAEITSEAGIRYDPTVVAALGRVVIAYRQRSTPIALRRHVLVVHPDPHRATVLAARLCSCGYLAETATDVETAAARMRQAPLEALVLSAELPEPTLDTFLDSIRTEEIGNWLPVLVLHAEPLERRVTLLERGADVCLPLGSPFDEIRATFGALVRRTVAAGVERMDGAASTREPWLALQGELRDFPLSWLLQVMAYDGRTAAVAMRGTGTERGVVFVERGAVRHARTRSAIGEAAMREMIRWAGGSFVVRSDLRTTARTIERPLMHLLLEEAVADDQAIFGAVAAG